MKICRSRARQSCVWALTQETHAAQALVGELGRPQEAQQWVQERTPWLEPAQRQRILDQLLQARSQQSSAEGLPTLQPTTPVHQEPAKSWGSPRFTQVCSRSGLEPSSR